MIALFKKCKQKLKRFFILIRIKVKLFFKKPDIIYIINNYPTRAKTERIIRLENIIQLNFPNVRIITIHYSEIDFNEINKSKGLILTGSSHNVSSFYGNKDMERLFEKELALIRDKYKKPILAICFGHQLAAYAFDSKVKRMRYRVVNNDVASLDIKLPDELIPHESVFVNLNHKDYITPYDNELRKNFRIIATLDLDSYKTVQYMRHKKKPLYSVQFHPENHIANYHYPPHIDDAVIDKAKLAGEKIITDFVDLCL
jgi:GMP synthase-like glutamine amidotransferase